MCSATAHVCFVPKADIRPNGRLGGTLNSQVDLAAKRPEIDRLGEKRFSAVLQSFALGVRVAIGAPAAGCRGCLAPDTRRLVRPRAMIDEATLGTTELPGA